jgi:signal transduction histidine kinase
VSGIARPVRIGLAPARWVRLPRRTARLRLTLLYSALFLLAGTCVLAGVYLLVARGSPIAVRASHAVGVVPVRRDPVFGIGPAVPSPSGVGPDVAAQIKQNVSAQRGADLGKLLAVSWVVLAISAVASAVLGWFAAGRVLRPLRAITTTARTISAGNLHQRLALSGPEDEFKQLGDTLDDLLSRLEASFEAQRRFVANASHELRTPLAVQRTLLQVALADEQATAADLRATCEELIACGAEHERLLEALLTLASTDRGLDCEEPVDLAALTQALLDGAHESIERQCLRLESDLAPTNTSGEPALLERLVSNLIDNATSHNVPGGWIAIRTERIGAVAALTVANSGPVVASSELARLFEPFQRAGGRSVQTDGHFGVGLSIVRAIANAHGATVEAQPQGGGGLTITVRFLAA